MQNDIEDAKRRLELARKETLLRPSHREILCDIIASEISGTLKGCYADIPIQVYHHPLCSGYSSTTIKRMTDQTYNHWYVSRDEQSKVFRFGSAFHAFCNEPHIFEEDYLISTADNRRAKEYKIDVSKANGRIILLSSEFKVIEVMSRKLFDHPDAGPLLKNAEFELTYFSKDSATGLWKKCRLDGNKNRRISDLKTTESASEYSFTMDSKKYLTRISASYYLEIVTEVTGFPHTEFNLVPCEKTEPWECAVYRVHESSVFKAQSEIRTALQKIRDILDQGEKAWRGYQLGIKSIAI